VLPVAAFELAAHGQATGVEVDVVPHEAEDLAAAQAEGDREHERGAVGLVGSCYEKLPGLVDRERFNVGRVVAGRVGEGDRVAEQASASDGVVEGLVQGATHVVDGARIEPLGESQAHAWTPRE
jgi:hypothetical protein